jgi:serine/threonine-protein kinase PpkA
MIAIPGYRIERELGQGGMAIVHLAVQESLARPVALKLLKPSLAADPQLVERFLHEGRLAARLHHRHIVAIHDVGVHLGQPYMALEYLSGGSLAARTKAMGVEDALQMLAQIASALAVAHSAGRAAPGHQACECPAAW